MDDETWAYAKEMAVLNRCSISAFLRLCVNEGRDPKSKNSAPPKTETTSPVTSINPGEEKAKVRKPRREDFGSDAAFYAAENAWKRWQA